jgi:hypothetical protein
MISALFRIMLPALAVLVFCMYALPMSRAFALDTTVDNTSNNQNYSWLIGNSGDETTAGNSDNNALTIDGAVVSVSNSAIGGYSSTGNTASGNTAFLKMVRLTVTFMAAGTALAATLSTTASNGPEARWPIILPRWIILGPISLRQF